MKKWRAYERLVASIIQDECDDSLTLIPNARIIGYISKRKRQIDILIDYRFNTDLKRRVIVDAKDRKRPIDIKEVESFEGLMRDVNATRGYLVCSNGYTKAALLRAQEHIGIRLISSEDVESLDLSAWERCCNSKCEKGLVLWDANPGVIIEGSTLIQSTGKCDECGQFHVWCWNCGSKKNFKLEEDWQCACKGPWFWLTSTEVDNDKIGYSGKGRYLILVMGNGNYEIVDRRPV
jgi:hypothetical protein